MLKNSEKKFKKCWNAKETRWTLEVVIQKIWVKGFASKQYTDQKKISARETKVHFTEKREESRGRRKEYGRPRQEVGSKEGRGGRQKGEGLTKYCIKGVG